MDRRRVREVLVARFQVAPARRKEVIDVALGQRVIARGTEHQVEAASLPDAEVGPEQMIVVGEERELVIPEDAEYEMTPEMLALP